MAAPPPPAPFIGPSLDEAIARVRAGDLPLTVGRGSPQATIAREGDGFFLFDLEVDEDAARADADEGAKAGYYVPEMRWRRLRKGTVLASATKLEEFVALLKRHWRSDWGPAR